VLINLGEATTKSLLGKGFGCHVYMYHVWALVISQTEVIYNLCEQDVYESVTTLNWYTIYKHDPELVTEFFQMSQLCPLFSSRRSAASIVV
jgi:hypothetical protein